MEELSKVTVNENGDMFWSANIFGTLSKITGVVKYNGLEELSFSFEKK